MCGGECHGVVCVRFAEAAHIRSVTWNALRRRLVRGRRFLEHARKAMGPGVGGREEKNAKCESRLPSRRRGAGEFPESSRSCVGENAPEGDDKERICGTEPFGRADGQRGGGHNVVATNGDYTNYAAREKARVSEHDRIAVGGEQGEPHVRVGQQNDARVGAQGTMGHSEPLSDAREVHTATQTGSCDAQPRSWRADHRKVVSLEEKCEDVAEKGRTKTRPQWDVADCERQAERSTTLKARTT
ncbi:hypothetical protein ERJ75_001037000 [Trypanosoma vivax]|nr:hypothetical protein ERJ75_001037000 [Trypanosoma vivax]